MRRVACLGGRAGRSDWDEGQFFLVSAIKIHLIEIAGHYDRRVGETEETEKSGCTIAEVLLFFSFSDES